MKCFRNITRYLNSTVSLKLPWLTLFFFLKLSKLEMILSWLFLIAHIIFHQCVIKRVQFQNKWNQSHKILSTGQGGNKQVIFYYFQEGTLWLSRTSSCNMTIIWQNLICSHWQAHPVNSVFTLSLESCHSRDDYKTWQLTFWRGTAVLHLQLSSTF